MCANNRSKRRAMSLLEVMLATGLVGLLLALLASAFSSGETVFRSVTGNADAVLELRTAATRIRRDVLGTRYDSLAAGPGPDSLGASNADGSALWMLSNTDPQTGGPLYHSDGSPHWVRNVLYYLAVPLNHAQLYGTTCAGGNGPGGLDDQCPHKILVRKVVDSGAPSSVTDSEDPDESLMNPGDLTPAMLDRPNGYSAASLGGSGLKSAQIVCRSLLFFRAQKLAGSVSVDLRAVSLPRARRVLPIGNVSLYDSAFTRAVGLSLQPAVR